MRIASLRERIEGERRVAITPDSTRQLVEAGLVVTIERGAGAESGYSDAAYEAAGAEVAATVALGTVDVIAHVRPLTVETIRALKAGAITVGLASAASELAAVRALRDARITSFALELVPRISRAQSMDALTSQSLVTGYRSVLEASMRFPRFFPLYMTAAGTIPPAKVLVLGAGVAGLQAIATAKRLGAKVSAYDVRAASADEVASMGGTFISLDLEAADAAGGYAKELAEDRAARQRELLTPHIQAADVIITTALIPGRPAPQLVTAEMLGGMRAGSVIVDLAAESGGNVEGAVAGEDVLVPVADGVVTLVGAKNMASAMAFDASRLYAKNVANLVALMTTDGTLTPDFDDEVVAGACLTHDGAVRHEPTAAALETADDTKKGKN
jgi:H+-translocating NAD(P) transhydrogenase subunit alpha